MGLAVQSNHRTGRKRSLRHCGPVRRLHPAGKSGLSEGLHPCGYGFPCGTDRQGVRRAGAVSRATAPGQRQAPRRLPPLLYGHEVGPRTELPHHSEQRRSWDRTVCGDHLQAFLIIRQTGGSCLNSHPFVFVGKAAYSHQFFL